MFFKIAWFSTLSGTLNGISSLALCMVKREDILDITRCLFFSNFRKNFEEELVIGSNGVAVSWIMHCFLPNSSSIWQNPSHEAGLHVGRFFQLWICGHYLHFMIIFRRLAVYLNAALHDLMQPFWTHQIIFQSPSQVCCTYPSLFFLSSFYLCPMQFSLHAHPICD